MTKRDFYTSVIAANISADITAHAQAELTALDDRNHKRSNSNAEKKAAEYAPLMQAAEKAIAGGKHFAAEIAGVLGVSTSKAVAILNKCVEGGTVKVHTEKVPKVGTRNYYELVTP